MSVDGELGSKAKRMLADFRGEHSPPVGAADAMLAGIQARLAEPAPTDPEPLDPGPGSASRLARLRGWVVVGGLVIAGTWAAVAARGEAVTDDDAPSGVANVEAPEEPARPIEAPQLERPKLAEAPTRAPEAASQAAPPATPAAAVDPQPGASPRRAAPRRASIEPAAAAPVDGAALKEELALLRRAQQAIARDDAAGARAALDEHEQRFADGTLAGEREATRILVVCAEDPIRGRAALDRYLASHPRSPYVERLRTSCGAKDSKPDALDTGDAPH